MPENIGARLDESVRQSSEAVVYRCIDAEGLVLRASTGGTCPVVCVCQDVAEYHGTLSQATPEAKTRHKLG